MLLQSPGNRGLEGRKSSVGSTVFLHTSAKIQLRNLASKFQIWVFIFIFYMEHWIFEFDIKVPWEPKMLIGRLCHASNYSFFSMSIKRGMEVRLSKACTRGFSPSLWERKTSGNQGNKPMNSSKKSVCPRFKQSSLLAEVVTKFSFEIQHQNS